MKKIYIKPFIIILISFPPRNTDSYHFDAIFEPRRACLLDGYAYLWQRFGDADDDTASMKCREYSQHWVATHHVPVTDMSAGELKSISRTLFNKNYQKMFPAAFIRVEMILVGFQHEYWYDLFLSYYSWDIIVDFVTCSHFIKLLPRIIDQMMLVSMMFTEFLYLFFILRLIIIDFGAFNIAIGARRRMVIFDFQQAPACCAAAQASRMIFTGNARERLSFRRLSRH